MKIPARCNKRACQARRNLSKHPQEYHKHPRCHMPGCDGKMYVDSYRLQKLEVRQRPVCRCDGYWYPHRVDSPDCKHSVDWVMENSLKPVSRHSPKTTEEMF